MSQVSISKLIPASPEAVWKVVMDPKRLDDWVTIHRGLGAVDGGQPGEGFHMEQRICLRGVDFKVRWELEECRPASCAVWEGRGPARSHARTEYLLEAEGEGTRFRYRNEFKAPLGPLGAVASRALVGGIPEKEARRSLDRLAALFS